MRLFPGSKSLSGLLSRIVVAAVLIAIVGCGGGDLGDKYKGDRGSVSGKVTFKGAPIPAGSMILFQSKEGNYAAGGKTNEKGEYTLSYNGGQSQMPAVSYKVQISPPPAKTDTSDVSKMTTPQDGAATEAPAAPFPTKYNAAATSGLQTDVAKGTNKKDFELVDDAQ